MKTTLKESHKEDIIISFDSEGTPYSYYSSDKWVLWSLDKTISFSNFNGDFKSTIKNIIFNILNKKTLNSKKGLIHHLISGASTIANCIKEAGGSDYNFIDNDRNYRLFLEAAKKRKLKYKTWKNHFIFLKHSYEEGFINRTENDFEKLSVYLAPNGNHQTQAICLPEKVAAIYYGEALKFVERMYSYRHDISDSYSVFLNEYKRLYEKKVYSCNFSIRHHAMKKIQTDFHGLDISFDYGGIWLSRLRGACYMVIAAFTGCRDGEVKSFNIDSYQEKQYSGFTVSTLNGKHTKPNIGGVERPTSWVTIPSVKKAIELLWDAFKFIRDEWKVRANDIKHIDEKNNFLRDANSLFLTIPSKCRSNPKAGKQAISDSLKSFIKSINYRVTLDDVKEFNLLNPTRYEELKVGEVLRVHPHCFRRTFAVYIVRNKLASLLDVKYQFKHMNIIVTSWYANHANIASSFDMMIDLDLQEEIAGENKNYTADIFYYLYNDAETLAGPEGKRIKNLRTEGDTTIYLSKNEILKQIEDGRLSIIEHPGGYCTNPKCDRICDMTVCQYKVVTLDQTKSLVSTRENLIQKHNAMLASDIDMPNVISKIFFEIRSIEKVLSEHNIGFEVFNTKELIL